MLNTPKSKPDYLAKLAPDIFYHIYNRTNNREPLYKDDDDRKYFLEQYKRFVSEYVNTYAYCLLPNHFHLMVHIKPEIAIDKIIQNTPEVNRSSPQRVFLNQPNAERNYHPILERQFTRMFTAYALYFNRRHQRSGNLFYRPFKRLVVANETHLQWLLYYIHHNPRKHGITEYFKDYPWSSYPTLIVDKPSALCRQEVWNLFAGKERFIEFHEKTDAVEPTDWNLEIEH